MPVLLDPVAAHRPLGDVVYHHLRSAILDGRLQPGQWLRQEALAQELGLSQMPVREALRRLVAEGLAERIPYTGVRVVTFTPEDIVDMMTVRLVLESLAVRHAALSLTAGEFTALHENLRQAAGCTRPEQMDRRRQLNSDFHLAICRASGRRTLIRQIEMLWDRFPSVMLYEGMRRQEELSAERLARESEEHVALLGALERRNPRQAEEVTRRHIRNLALELSEVLGLSPADTEPLLAF